MQNIKTFLAPFGRGLVKLGKALMLPIAVLPIAGLLLRLGQPDLLNIAFVAEAGQAVFTNLPVIFALGIAIGFADENHGAAALAAYVGYVILTASLRVLDESIDMGVLGGIIVGITAGLLYNKYKSIKLPSYLAFFGGRRFVPIVTGAVCLVIAGLAAQGTTEIGCIHHIERGYEDIVRKLSGVGADIRVVVTPDEEKQSQVG